MAIGTNKIWYGKSNNAPIELITTLNVSDYAQTSIEPFQVKYPNTTVSITADNISNLEINNTDRSARSYNLAVIARPNITCPKNLTDAGRILVNISGSITANIKYSKPSSFDEYDDWDADYWGHLFDICTQNCQTINTWAATDSLRYPEIYAETGDSRDDLDSSDNLYMLDSCDTNLPDASDMSLSVNKTFTISLTKRLYINDGVISGLFIKSHVGITSSRYTYLIAIGGSVKLNNIIFTYTRL